MADTIETNQNNNLGEGTQLQEQDKTFTQADVDRIISERLAKVKGTTVDTDEYKSYQTWKKTQKTEAERIAEREKEFTAAANELAQLKAEKTVMSANAKPEFSEFVAIKVLGMEGDFKTNLEAFKKSNPQYFGEVIVKKTASSYSMSGGGTAPTSNQIMNDVIRGYRN